MLDIPDYLPVLQYSVTSRFHHGNVKVLVIPVAIPSGLSAPVDDIDDHAPGASVVVPSI